MMGCNQKRQKVVVDQHTGGNGLIHGNKRHKDNLLQSLELPIRIS